MSEAKDRLRKSMAVFFDTAERADDESEMNRKAAKRNRHKHEVFSARADGMAMVLAAWDEADTEAADAAVAKMLKGKRDGQPRKAVVDGKGRTMPNPCILCGADEHYVEQCSDGFTVKCERCHRKTEKCDTWDIAVGRWNELVSPAAAVYRIQGMKRTAAIEEVIRAARKWVLDDTPKNAKPSVRSRRLVEYLESAYLD